MKEILKKILLKLSPTLYLKIIYKRAMGEKLNLRNPRNFNEKIQWLKLRDYPNNELVIECADKYRMHNYLARKGLSQYSVKILGHFDKFNDIDWNSLPSRFVLKMNHGSNFNIFIENKENVDLNEIKQKLSCWEKMDYGQLSVERHYSKIQPLIIAEDFLDLDLDRLEYNFYCFNGEPKFCRAIVFEDIHAKISKGTCYMLPSWEKVDFNYSKYELLNNIPHPEKLEIMLNICSKISKDFQFVRIDFLLLKNKGIILGELTFSPASGMISSFTDEALDKMGNWLKIRDSKGKKL